MNYYCYLLISASGRTRAQTGALARPCNPFALLRQLGRLVVVARRELSRSVGHGGTSRRPPFGRRVTGGSSRLLLPGRSLARALARSRRKFDLGRSWAGRALIETEPRGSAQSIRAGVRSCLLGRILARVQPIDSCASQTRLASREQRQKEGGAAFTSSGLQVRLMRSLLECRALAPLACNLGQLTPVPNDSPNAPL